MLVRTIRRTVLVLALLSVLGACALDREEDLRADLARWLFLAQTRHFTSKSTCTVGIFDLVAGQVRGAVPRARTMEEAQKYLKAGKPVVFDMPGASPNEISEAVMSRDLGQGLGMLSSGVGPALECMSDEIGAGFYAVLMSPETITVYDPGGNALLLVYPPENLALFLRGNV